MIAARPSQDVAGAITGLGALCGAGHSDYPQNQERCDRARPYGPLHRHSYWLACQASGVTQTSAHMIV